MPVKRILVVEDDTHTADLVAETLKMEGFFVLKAGSGEEALEVLKKEGVDLILMDMLLPGIKGWKLADELKKDPKTANIPILVVSILAPDETNLQKDNASIRGFVCKPFDLSVLIQEVKKNAH